MAESNCIDVGCHEGEVLDEFLKISPAGNHFAFEPLPYLYKKLISRYKSFPNCTIYDYALSNTEGTSPFNHVITNPAYSGIKKRKYDRKNEKDEEIIVMQKRLDDVVPPTIKIDFIKIDVEGGEFEVLEGAKKNIIISHPLLVFEFGIGGSDIYGVTPEKLFGFLKTLDYKVNLLDRFIKKATPLSLNEFRDQFNNKKNYYFIAYYSPQTQSEKFI